MALQQPKTLAAALCIALMGILGIVQLVLVARVIAWTDSDSTLSGQAQVTIPNERAALFQDEITLPIGLLPEMMTKTGTSFMFWTGCGSVVDSLLLGGMLAGLKSYRNHRLLNIYAVICAVVIIRPLVVLIYVFVEYRGAAKELDLPFSNSGSQPSDFTPESWTCTLQKYISSSDSGTQSSVRGICDQSLAARYFLIPILLVSLLVVACLYYQRKGTTGRDSPKGTSSADQVRASPDDTAGTESIQMNTSEMGTV